MLSSISLFLLLALRVAGDSIGPTNATLPAQQAQLVMDWSGMIVNVAPLTTGAGLGASATELKASCLGLAALCS